MDTLHLSFLSSKMPEFEKVRWVRTEVFVKEQQVPEDEEWDEADETALHLLGWDTSTQQPCATGRLIWEKDKLARIGRMAVLREYRGRGVGEVMLHCLVAKAWQHGCNRIVLHSQVHATGFYKKAGFKETGDLFEEAGIPHVTMELKKGAGSV